MNTVTIKRLIPRVAAAAVLGLVTIAALADAGPGATLSVPGFGPGIAGNVIEGPTTPVCMVGVPCTQPFANAQVLVRDAATRTLIAGARTNASGNFILGVPQGSYIVQVMTATFPVCPEQTVTVTGQSFSMTQIACDTGIR